MRKTIKEMSGVEVQVKSKLPAIIDCFDALPLLVPTRNHLFRVFGRHSVSELASGGKSSGIRGITAGDYSHVYDTDALNTNKEHYVAQLKFSGCSCVCVL